jgi:hypothetical protein
LVSARRLVASFAALAVMLAACGGGGGSSDEAASATLRTTTTLRPTPTTIDPIVRANEAGQVAQCNDGGFSTNTDFRATCSGGDGIQRWLSTFGECVDGRVIVMSSDASCDDNGGFKGLLPRDFTPEAGPDDVALCKDGNFSDNTDFLATCSGGDGVDRWLATYGECSDGSTITMSANASCPAGASFVGLRAADYEPSAAALPDFVGQRLDDAIDDAEAFSLDVTFNDADEDRTIIDTSNWFVVRQSIAPDTPVLPGRSLVLGVSKNDPADPASSSPELSPASVEAELAAAFGVPTFADVCTESAKFCFVTGIETSSDEIVVTLQFPDRDEAFGEDIARTMWGLIGANFPNLEYIRANNAVGDVLADVSCVEAIGEQNCS